MCTSLGSLRNCTNVHELWLSEKHASPHELWLTVIELMLTELQLKIIEFRLIVNLIRLIAHRNDNRGFSILIHLSNRFHY